MIINNQSNVTFDYVLPDQQTKSGEQESNLVQTEILTSAVSRVKSSDKFFLNEGETAKQNIVVTNNSGTTLSSMFFQDTMSSGATHVPGSVSVNGVSQPSYDPVAGFALDDIPSGGNASIEYTIQANSPKTDNTVTNTGAVSYSVNDPVRGTVLYTEPTNEVQLRLITTRIQVEKSVDKGYAVSGETLHYTSVVTNTGDLDKVNMIFKDAIPSGTQFVPGSVKIDEVSYPAYDPAVGFSIKDLKPGESTKVEFDVTVE